MSNCVPPCMTSSSILPKIDFLGQHIGISGLFVPVEGAEGAFCFADIGIVYVTVYDKGHPVFRMQGATYYVGTPAKQQAGHPLSAAAGPRSVQFVVPVCSSQSPEPSAAIFHNLPDFLRNPPRLQVGSDTGQLYERFDKQPVIAAYEKSAAAVKRMIRRSALE